MLSCIVLSSYFCDLLPDFKAFVVPMLRMRRPRSACPVPLGQQLTVALDPAMGNAPSHALTHV